jgi:hypothetical protein
VTVACPLLLVAAFQRIQQCVGEPWVWEDARDKSGSKRTSASRTAPQLNALFTFFHSAAVCMCRNLTHTVSHAAYNCKRKSRNKQEKYPTDNYPKWLFIKSCRNPTSQPFAGAKKQSTRKTIMIVFVGCIPRACYSCSPFFALCASLSLSVLLSHAPRVYRISCTPQHPDAFLESRCLPGNQAARGKCQKVACRQYLTFELTLTKARI